MIKMAQPGKASNYKNLKVKGGIELSTWRFSNPRKAAS